jgi:hypothetical protein
VDGIVNNVIRQPGRNAFVVTKPDTATPLDVLAFRPNVVDENVIVDGAVTSPMTIDGDAPLGVDDVGPSWFRRRGPS